MANDTIVAVSTPPGVGGVALVRVSGDAALQTALKRLTAGDLAPRTATFTKMLDTEGAFLDEGIAIYYPAPHSYTGEDTVEITCHGSLYVQQALVASLVEAGGRLATAGEFTLRAFRNGKLNLVQAEAVADLIDAATPAQHRLAMSQLRGGYARKLEQMRSRMLDLTSLLELELDFSQEDVEFADRAELMRLARELQSEVDGLLRSFAAGNALKQGIEVALVGRPNVGKSTLLNALLGDDRAIVSPVPGTTRDTVEGLLTLDGLTFRLVDTAGLRTTNDSVELLGIQRSRAAYDSAPIVIHVGDATQPDAADFPSDGKRHLRVLNKADLIAPGAAACQAPDAILLSAREGKGMDELKEALVQAARSMEGMAADVLLSNVRHRDALLHVKENLAAVVDGLSIRLPADLVAVDLRAALHHLGTITGQVTTDQVLGNIFSRFCIGK